jgi:SAM-dependent MidA family methyltransferase
MSALSLLMPACVNAGRDICPGSDLIMRADAPRQVDMSADTSHLPEPDAFAREHSERLVELIRDDIAQAGGRIPFARYMELALYAPGMGYYSAGSVKLGEAGDFVTAPEISPLFAFCLARQCRPVLQAAARGEILEFGAGSGALACDLLRELEGLGTLPVRYGIVELSADLRARQQAHLRERVPHLLDRVTWFERLPDTPLNGVILANEVIDAMPVHRLVKQDSWCEQYVGWKEGAGFVYEAGPLSDAHLTERVREIVDGPGEDSFAKGYELEISLAAERWLAAAADALARGVILLADYGQPRAEYYHPRRQGGTLRCFYRHRVHGNPLILTGLQDITADVEFTALAEAAVGAGLEVAGYVSQAYFLLGGGLLEWEERLQQAAPLERMRLAQQIRRLTLPGEMGERFKVMALVRGVDMPLPGFAFRDERGRL